MTPFEDLVARVAERLDERNVRHRVIGATALAAHGVARSTRDVDLLVVDVGVLDPAVWAGHTPDGFALDVRRGDASDPLVGVVRFTEELDDDDSEHVPAALDIVVLASRWAGRAVAGAGPELRVGDTVLRAVSLVDLILLKLYAGGPKDGWDVASLLAAHGDSLVAAVEARLDELPTRCARFWRRLRPEPETP